MRRQRPGFSEHSLNASGLAVVLDSQFGDFVEVPHGLHGRQAAVDRQVDAGA